VKERQIPLARSFGYLLDPRQRLSGDMVDKQVANNRASEPIGEERKGVAEVMGNNDMHGTVRLWGQSPLDVHSTSNAARMEKEDAVFFRQDDLRGAPLNREGNRAEIPPRRHCRLLHSPIVRMNGHIAVVGKNIRPIANRCAERKDSLNRRVNHDFIFGLHGFVLA
jgi:hypothetical protein